MSRFFDSFALHRRSSVEPQNAAAWPPTLRTGWVSIVLCSSAIAIGIIALIGYALASASIASLGTEGKPVAAVAALALILLGAGLLALRSPAPAGLLTARRAALCVIVLAAADLLSAAFSRNIEEWKVWSARGGVDVHAHAYPFAALLLIASASALVFVTTRKDFAGHLIASAVLSICSVLSFGYFLQVPSFLDPSILIAPAAPAILGMVLISAGVLLARPRGWVVPLLARTPAGLGSRLLLAAAIVVPFTALALRARIVDAPWYTHEVGLTVIVAANVFFSATIVLGLGVILHKRESERARLASIVDSSDDAIIATSSAGVIESWGAGAERMYGYTAAEAIGRSVTMLAPPERQDEAPGLLERIRRGERIGPFETVRVAKDGRRIDVWLSVSLVLDDDGNVVGASSIARDITQRKQEQEALRRSEELLRAAQRAGGIGHFCWDIQTNINTWSDELVALYGLTPGSFEGQYENWRKQIFPDDLPAADAQIRNSLTSGEFSCDFRIVWPDASIHWMHASAKVLFSDDGKPLRMVGVNMDITERKQAEEALRNREDTLQRTFDVIPVGLWFADKDGKLLRGNPAGVKIWGAEPQVSPSEYGIFKARRLPSGEEVAPDDWALVHVIRDKVTIVDELLEIDTFDGKKKTILNYAAPVLDAQGDLQGAIVINQDITERRQAEEAVQQARERTQSLSRQLLEIQEADRRQLARELHDELGQALTATKINLQSLQRYPEPATIAARLGESIVIVDRALGQVRSLLLELRPPLLDDLGLAAALRWLADQHASRAELRVEFRSSAADARFDAAVETACFRVAQEALTNVVRHAGARHVTIELQALEDMLHLRVIDDGAGFDVPAARRRASKGASLGLLGMEERVLLAGGGIEWRSSPGQGAEVHAWFPLPGPAATHDETAATA